MPVTVKKAALLALSPNPTRGLLTVKYSGTASAGVIVEVIDMAGNRVYNRQHIGSSFTVDLSTLPGGTYLVKVGEELRQVAVQK